MIFWLLKAGKFIIFYLLTVATVFLMICLKLCLKLSTYNVILPKFIGDSCSVFSTII